MALETLLYIIVVFALSALPLNLAVKILSGHSTLFRVVLVNIVAAVITYAINLYFPHYGTIISFFTLLFMYSVMFDLSYFRAFIAWILQFVIIIIFWAAIMYLFQVNIL